MDSTKPVKANKVPFGQKLAFGAGMLANQMFPAALAIFMVVLVQDLGFSPLQHPTHGNRSNNPLFARQKEVESLWK